MARTLLALALCGSAAAFVAPAATPKAATAVQAVTDMEGISAQSASATRA